MSILLASVIKVERAFDLRSPGYEQNACQARKPRKTGLSCGSGKKVADADQQRHKNCWIVPNAGFGDA
jgi:hypothetical protein